MLCDGCFAGEVAQRGGVDRGSFGFGGGFGLVSSRGGNSTGLEGCEACGAVGWDCVG